MADGFETFRKNHRSACRRLRCSVWLCGWMERTWSKLKGFPFNSEDRYPVCSSNALFTKTNDGCFASLRTNEQGRSSSNFNNKVIQEASWPTAPPVRCGRKLRILKIITQQFHENRSLSFGFRSFGKILLLCFILHGFLFSSITRR